MEPIVGDVYIRPEGIAGYNWGILADLLFNHEAGAEFYRSDHSTNRAGCASSTDRSRAVVQGLSAKSVGSVLQGTSTRF